MNTKLTLIVLTFNEELHLARCLASAKGVADEIIVVDSLSTDGTRAIAEGFGATFVTHPFENQAKQFNWALANVPVTGEWVLRLDADEYLTPELGAEIRATLAKDTPPRDGEFPVNGYYLRRRVIFMGRWIRHGGYYPTWILRLFRRGKGRSEEREVDEHIALAEGAARSLENDFVDENLHDLAWWIAKHNDYSAREASAVRRELGEVRVEIEGDPLGDPTERKRWFKENLYLKLPPLWRGLGYFLYRYFIRRGFLDGKEGLIFHFLQGGWYRFLVDAKLYEQENMRTKEHENKGTLNQENKRAKEHESNRAREQKSKGAEE